MAEQTQASFLGIVSKSVPLKMLQALGLSTAGMITGVFKLITSSLVSAQLTSTFFDSGLTLTQTFITMPALLSPQPPHTPSPRTLAQQFHANFDRAKYPAATVAWVGGGLFAYLAWREPSIRTTSFKCYVAAGLTCPLTVIYTLGVIMKTNISLIKRAEGTDSEPVNIDKDDPRQRGERSLKRWAKILVGLDEAEHKDMTTYALIDRWTALNLGRGILGVINIACCAWAVVDEDLSFFE